MSDHHQMELKLLPVKENPQPYAILLIGSTGTGKSSTIMKCTGENVITGDGPDGVTRRSKVYW